MNKIRELRKNAHINQTELASIIGVSQSTLSYWERGDYEPDNASLISLADYFSVSVDYILGRTDEPTPKKEKAPSDISTEEALMVAFTDMLGRKPTEDELRRFWEMGKLFFDAKDKSPD